MARHLSLQRALSLRRSSTTNMAIAFVLVWFSCLTQSRQAAAGIPVSSLFWHVCISVSELDQGAVTKDRNDLAARVAALVQPKLDLAQAGRKTRSEPHCLKEADPGFDRQLRLLLSVKRQKVKFGDESVNIALAGGVSSNGLFQERDEDPVVLLDRDVISDERVISILVEFVDKSVVELARKQTR